MLKLLFYMDMKDGRSSVYLKRKPQITDRIQLLIKENRELKKWWDVLKTIPGIGEIVAFELLILLPELGTLCRRKIASLAGVAPRANDSGKFSGYRKTGYGRSGVKPILFLAM